MTFLKYAAIILFSLVALILLIFAFKSRKPLKFILFNAFIGLATLLILYFTRKFTGLNVTLNLYTVIGSSILGMPAVIMVLIINLIMFM